MRWIPAVLLVGLCYTQPDPTAWRSMFDGRSLGQWRPTGFTGAGIITIQGGAVELHPGSPLTGITWAGEFPRAEYEIRYEAIRRKGNDFFASLTFPVGDSHGTFVTGGWGRDIVGFSSIDGWDASENETRTYFVFDNERWYAFRLRVASDRVTAWIDEKQVFSFAIAGREISLRPGEIEKSAPLGFASFRTHGAVRKIEYRMLKPPAVLAARSSR